MAYEMKDFNKDVIESSDNIPVVIDFWAEWCGPCRMLSPTLEKLAGQAAGKWKLVKINTEEFPQIAAQFRVRSIPSVKMVYQKSILAEFTGALPEHQIRKWLQDNLPASEDENDSKEAYEKYLKDGNRDKAREVLANMVNGNTDDKDRLALLAMLYLPDDLDKAGQYMKTLSEEPKYEIEQQTFETIQHLIKVANNKVRVTGNNDSVVAEYKAGAQLLSENNFEGALERFIDCLIKDRSMDNEGPRKACIAIFTLLGNEHPVTRQYRRRFSMALY